MRGFVAPAVPAARDDLACVDRSPITEALYLLGQKAGYPGQDALLRWIDTGRLVVVELTDEERERTIAFSVNTVTGPATSPMQL